MQADTIWAAYLGDIGGRIEYGIFGVGYESNRQTKLMSTSTYGMAPVSAKIDWQK